ncbi:hypothetical protein RF11_02145 [Thelohanellus kitauei]|uniref:Uncharacterized protein n=1 Tax=Thelohanellus kitauei TaxID=669202 RepID=A0A0C2JXT1_THEKT|nr:hypothetical protein RF11_02145 [Thelohanellus kitauei]
MIKVIQCIKDHEKVFCYSQPPIRDIIQCLYFRTGPGRYIGEPKAKKYYQEFLQNGDHPDVLDFHEAIIKSLEESLNKSVEFNVIIENEWPNIIRSVAKNHNLAGYQYFEVYCYAEQISFSGFYMAYYARGIFSNYQRDIFKDKFFDEFIEECKRKLDPFCKREDT